VQLVSIVVLPLPRKYHYNSSSQLLFLSLEKQEFNLTTMKICWNKNNCNLNNNKQKRDEKDQVTSNDNVVVELLLAKQNVGSTKDDDTKKTIQVATVTVIMEMLMFTSMTAPK
jgi:hypothetical protein